MDVDGKPSNSRPPSPSQQAKFVLQPTNALAGPSTIPDQPAIPPVYLPPPPERSKPRPPFDSTQDLLSRFQLLSAYDKYVRPYSLPVDAAGGSQGPSLSAAEKGKGKERELLPRDVASPAAQTPGAGGDGDDEEQQGKGEKKWKSSYKHMIKGIPGKHSMKKDDYLMTMMQVPPKQRIAITPFDIRTQRDAFSVSLDGLKGWNMNVLVAESPQAREDRKRRKELKKLAKQGGTLAAGTSPAAIPVTPGPTAVSTPGAVPAAQPSQAHPRHGSQPPSKLSVSTPTQPPQQTSSQPSGITPAGVGTPRPVGTPVPPPGTTAPARHTPIPTPAPTPGGQTAGAGDNRRGVKREREESVTQLNGTTVSAQGPAPGVTVSTNGPAKTTGVVLNAKAGSGGVRPRPLKKQRMDTQGQAREMPVQQPTPHA